MTPEIIQEARKSLRSSFIEHPRFTETLKQLSTETAFSLPGRIFFLVGPPGFGVTTTARALKSLINKETQPFNPYQALEMTALVPTDGVFKWKQFFEQGLTTLNEPVVGQRLRAIDSPNGITKFAGNATFRSAQKYQNDFSAALQRRMTRTIIVQHAHNMTRGIDDKALGLPLDVMQQLAQGKGQTPQNVVLSGYPDLLKILTDDSSQYLHSKIIVVLPYAEEESEIAQFKILLAGYERLLTKIIEPFCLQNNAKDIYDKTLSGVGWIERTLSDSLVHLELRPDARLSWQDIKKQLPSQKEADSIHKCLQGLNDLLGAKVPEKDKKTVPLKSQNRSSIPFERKPWNDPVGFN